MSVNGGKMARPKSDINLNPEKYFINPIAHVRDRIIIHESSKIPKEGLFFSLNGFSFLAKPGVEIDIPRAVRKMLDTRIETETIQDSQGNIHTRNIPRVTYTLVKENIIGEEDDGVLSTDKEVEDTVTIGA